ASIFSSVFSLDAVYVLTGVALLIFALMTFVDRSNPRRVGSGCFWFTLGIIFMFGSVSPHWLTGMLVLFLVALDGFGQVGRGSGGAKPTTGGAGGGGGAGGAGGRPSRLGRAAAPAPGPGKRHFSPPHGNPTRVLSLSV